MVTERVPVSQPWQPRVLGLAVPGELGSFPACATAAPGPWVLCQWDTVGGRRGNSVLGCMAMIWAMLTELLLPQFPSRASPWACTSLASPAALWTHLGTPALPRAQPCASLPGAGLVPAPEALKGSQVTSDSEGDMFCDTLEQMEPEKVTEEALEALPSLPCLHCTAPPALEPHRTYRDTLLHISVSLLEPGPCHRGDAEEPPQSPHSCGAALMGHWGLLGLGKTSSSTWMPPPGLFPCHFSLLPAATGHI